MPSRTSHDRFLTKRPLPPVPKSPEIEEKGNRSMFQKKQKVMDNGSSLINKTGTDIAKRVIPIPNKVENSDDEDLNDCGTPTPYSVLKEQMRLHGNIRTSTPKSADFLSPTTSSSVDSNFLSSTTSYDSASSEVTFPRRAFGIYILIGNSCRLADLQTGSYRIFSFYVENVHYNLIVKLLNDHFGIQTRGGCACAGTYGHILLNVNKELSNQITCEILKGNQGEKPGWVRMSIHPTMTNNEIRFITESIKFVVENIDNLRKDYIYNSTSNEFSFNGESENVDIQSWFN